MHGSVFASRGKTLILKAASKQRSAVFVNT